jgi:KTSC domain
MLKLGYEIASSQISYLGHDSQKSVLVVAFKPDSNNKISIYEYANVNDVVFDNLMTSVSRGSYFINNIKKESSKFPFTRLQITDPVLVFEQILNESLYGTPFAQIPAGAFQIPQSFLKTVIAANAAWCW